MWLKTLLVLTLTAAAHAQTYTISTIAGGGPAIGQPATSYGLKRPSGVAVDTAGNVYVVLPNWCQVWVLSPSGTLTQVIGNGTCGFSGDGGPAASATLYPAGGVAVDSSGDIYIADSNNDRIRKVSGGIITTVAGDGSAGYNGDNISATSAWLYYPTGVAVDSSGSLYFADQLNNRVRKVSGGIITTVAGNGTDAYNGDNISATSAELNDPEGVAVDSSGNLYITDTLNNRIRKVTGGIITTVAGNGTAGYNGDNINATSANLFTPHAATVDSSGNLYIADLNNDRIRKVSGGVITTVAGNGTAGYNGDNISAASAEVNFPQALAVDSSGNLYIADTDNNRIRKVIGGIITTVVGDGYGDGGLATRAELTRPSGTAMDNSGNLFIADSNDCVVRKVSAGTGVISTVAGTGACGYNGDNISAVSAELNYPSSVAVDSSGNLYIADLSNSRVRKVSGGIITSVAGNGTAGYNGDNISAASAELLYPSGVAVDSSGNLYIADTDNNRIRKVSGGIITGVAGNGTAGYNGDNISATSSELNYPYGVAVDSSGNAYIADTDNNRIRKVSGGIVTTVGGNGICSYNGDNISATSAALCYPYGVTVDSSGRIFIADSDNARIRIASGGIITTVAGDGTAGFSGDGGPATGAALSPIGVALDTSGNVYVADAGNNRIRQLTLSTCTYILTPSSASVVAEASAGSVAVTTTGGCGWVATSNSLSWVSITSGSSGSGSGTVGYSVQSNADSEGRTGSLTIAGQSFPVIQAGQGCAVGLTPSSASLGSSGTSGSSVAVALSGVDCQWSANTTVPSWVTITSGGSGTGNGTINYTVSGNTLSSVARSGAIDITVSTISTQAAFNITEAGSTCSYALAQSSQSFGSSGGTGSATLVATGGCAWTASSSVSWVTITSGSSGTGNGTVSYTVQSNTASASRSGTLTIAGQAYVITQAGVSAPLSCAASVPAVAQVALEGRTEIVGDLLLNCSGLTSSITANILLTLNTSVTNTVTAGLSDAGLVNGSGTQYGQVLGYTTVEWPGVTLTPGSGGTASVRITNVRADASSLATGSNLQPAAITGVLAVNSTVAVPLSNAAQTLANAATTLAFQANTATTNGTQTTLPLLYQETAAGSFHVAAGNTPATRLRMVMSNIASGVTVYAPIGGTQWQLYGADCSGAGGSAITSGTSMAGGTYSQLTVSGGVASATWVAEAVDAGVIDTFTMPVLLVNPNGVSLSLVQVEGSLAPVSPAGTACAGTDPSAAVVPRYRDFSVAQTLVNLRLTTTITLTAAGAQVRAGGRGGVAAKPETKVSPLLVQPSVGFGANLTNESSSQAMTNGSVKGSVPTGTNQISCSATGGGTCSGSGGQYSCSWSSIPAGQSVSCSGSGGLSSSYTPGSSVTNTAGASGDQTPADPTTVESSSSATVTGGPPLVQILSPNPSSTVTGTITVGGYALDEYTAIGSVQILVDGNVVGNATWGTASPNQNICGLEYPGWAGCPNIGFTFLLNTSSLSAGSHAITAVATDMDTPVNTTTSLPVTVTVVQLPDLTVTKMHSGNFSPGQSGATYTITATNSGTGPTSGTVTLTDTLPTGLIATAMSGTGWSCTLATATCTRSDAIGGGGIYPAITLTVNVAVNAPASVTNTVAVSGGGETNTSNDTASDVTTIMATALRFVSVTPCRVVDTRLANGPFGGPGLYGNSRDFALPNGACGIPSTAKAYALNVTVVPGGPLGYLTIWPTGQPQPTVSTLNSLDGRIKANAAIVPAGTGGAITVYASAGTDVVLDINGYFTSDTSQLAFYPVTPCRVVDTRNATGTFGGPTMTAAQTRNFPVSSSTCNIPSTAAAYSLNFTVVPPGPLGYLTAWPAGGAQPGVSTLNAPTGVITANAAIVPGGTGSSISVYVSATTDVVIDINGYFAPNTGSGLSFYATTPCRAVDTRLATGSLGGPTLAGQRNYPLSTSACGLPGTAMAYSLNATVVPQTTLGYLTLWPTGQTMPVVSTLNSPDGSIVANAAIVPAVSGSISAFASATADLILDANGYFGP